MSIGMRPLRGSMTALRYYIIYRRLARAIPLRFASASRKESVREAIFGRHCDDFCNRAMHALARDFVRAYAVTALQ